MRRAALALLPAAALLACTTPYALGERRYREGDRLAALEIWRGVPSDSPYYESVQPRITAVENEFEQLVVRYKKRARYYESKDRLAESVLNYRLALKLQPDDRETLGHVQQVVRILDERKREAQAAYHETFERGELPAARVHLETLRSLDPFDPDYETDARQLEAALRSEVERLLALGRNGYRYRDYARASQAFDAVLRLDPENDTAQGYRSLVSTSRASWARDSQSRPRSGTLPGLNASEGEIRAEGFYQNALAAERAGAPYSAIRHDLRALSLASNHTKARAHLTQLRRSLSPQIEDLIEDGREHFQAEELQSALDQWRRVLLIEPDNKEAREYVNRAVRLLQNLEQLRSEPDRRVATE